MIPWLNPDRVGFPPIDRALAEPNGLLAAGGALTPEWLIAAYSNGIFPWFNQNEPILWWSPNPRAVFDPKQITVRRRLRQSMRNRGYVLKADTAFDSVIEGCAQPRKKQTGTWILPEMKEAYQALHLAGHAHSIECWQHDRLVGGMYGVALGSLFFGESMFSIERDASKCALIFLAHCMNQVNGPFIDCQVPNPHLESMGAFTIERKLFLDLLSKHQHDTPRFPIGSWSLFFPPLKCSTLASGYD